MAPGKKNSMNELPRRKQRGIELQRHAGHWIKSSAGFARLKLA